MDPVGEPVEMLAEAVWYTLTIPDARSVAHPHERRVRQAKPGVWVDGREVSFVQAIFADVGPVLAIIMWFDGRPGYRTLAPDHRVMVIP